jgi:hypothetical protein
MERTTSEAEQLLASARHADAVRAEAGIRHRLRKAASFESQELRAAAERDSAALRQQAADQREHLKRLKEAQESANQAIARCWRRRPKAASWQ